MDADFNGAVNNSYFYRLNSFQIEKIMVTSRQVCIVLLGKL